MSVSVTVVVTATTASVIAVCEEPAPAARTFQGSAQYAETVKGDTVARSITVGGDVLDLDPNSLKTEMTDVISNIKAVLDGESIAYEDVTVVYFEAPANGGNATVSITVTGAIADIQTFTVTTGGSTNRTISIDPV